MGVRTPRRRGSGGGGASECAVPDGLSVARSWAPDKTVEAGRIEGVQPSQQPAPTDCVSAVRNKPVNGTVIFGEDVPKRGNDKPKKDKKKDGESSSDS